MLKIEVLSNSVLIDGKEIKRKRLPWANHCREIFLYNDYVIKVVLNPMDYLSMDQNIFEYKKWKEISKNKDDSKYFAPVLFCKRNGLYLIQKRFYFRSSKRTESIREKVKQLCKKYDISDVPSYENRNWAMIGKDKPIIYDYGSEGYWSE